MYISISINARAICSHDARSVEKNLSVRTNTDILGVVQWVCVELRSAIVSSIRTGTSRHTGLCDPIAARGALGITVTGWLNRMKQYTNFVRSVLPEISFRAHIYTLKNTTVLAAVLQRLLFNSMVPNLFGNHWFNSCSRY